MSSQNDNKYICEYCGNKYSSVYTLNKHKATAKFCLEKQEKNVERNHTCAYCKALFNIKSTYDRHILTCKIRINMEEEQKKKEEEDKKKEEEQRYQLLLEEYQLLKLNYTALFQKTEYLILQSSEKDIQIEKLHIVIKEKDNIIKEKDTYIQDHPPITHVYNHTTQNSAQYSINIQTEFEKLTPFTEENVKNKVDNIKPIQLIEFNNYNLMLNFCSNIGRSLSDMAIVTDKARGLLLIKTKDGERQKYQSKSFIHDALVMAEPECKQLLNKTNSALVHLEIQQNIMPDDQARAHNDLTLLHYYITNKTMDTTVQGISNVLMNHCSYITRRLPGQPHITVEE